MYAMHADLTVEDDGNYTCEIRGNKSNVLASQTFSIIVQGMTRDKKITADTITTICFYYTNISRIHVECIVVFHP